LWDDDRTGGIAHPFNYGRRHPLAVDAMHV
jgi:hypothetical protein